ncbi:MAG: hypothetical protein ACE5OZ_23910 [Candidatus Heimdallarchaeota archaeon]
MSEEKRRNYDVKDLENFLINFFEEYRERLDRGYVPRSNLTDFSAPCQIHIIWFTPYDQQYFFVTHLDNSPDKEIAILKTGYKNALAVFEKWVSSDIWPSKLKSLNFFGSVRNHLYASAKRILDVQPHRIFRDWIIQSKNTVDYSDPFLKTSKGEIFGPSAAMWLNGFEWRLNGILELDLDNWIMGCLQETKLDTIADEKKAEATEPVEEKHHQAYGVQFSPLIWIGDHPFKDFKIYIQGLQRFEAEEIIIRTQFRNYPLWISKIGHFYLMCDHKGKALKILNELMALIVIFGEMKTRVIREYELGKGTLDIKEGKIKQWTGVITRERNWLSTQWMLKPEDFSDWLGEFIITSQEELEQLFNEITLTPEGYADLLALWLDSFTHFEEKSNAASFLLSWTLIEGLLTRVWQEYLDLNFSTRINSEIRRKMVDSPQWTASVILRSFQVTNQISDTVVNLLTKLRKHRNNLVHQIPFRDIQVTETQAKIAIDLSALLIIQTISNKAWNNFDSENNEKIERMLGKWG